MCGTKSTFLKEKVMEEISFYHIPILKDEIIQFFQSTSKSCFLDGTAGEGGHSYAILESFPDAKVVLLDRDPVMLDRALNRTHSFASTRWALLSNFSELDRKDLPEEFQFGLDGILLDFGISMFHLKKSGRGFSFIGEEELDMRLQPEISKTASSILNTYKEDRLYQIFKEYGEENWSKKIVEAILTRRKRNPLKTTQDLAKLVESVIPRKFWPPKAHPSFRIFQALRIEVNDELSHIEIGLKRLIPLLKENGIICCISFHSLEDRIVKTVFKQFSIQKELELITKKPILPTEIEILKNPAARSAKLRVGRKINPEVQS
jgi:16S rRNA (cytosine1402-N4)-methyltransferase